MSKVTMDTQEFLAQGLAVTEYYQPDMLWTEDGFIARFQVVADTDDNSWYCVEAHDTALPKCPSKPSSPTPEKCEAFADRIFNAVYWLEYDWTNYTKPWLQMGKHFYFVCAEDRSHFSQMLETNARRTMAFIDKMRKRYRNFNFQTDQAWKLFSSTKRRVDELYDSIDRNLSRFFLTDWCNDLPMDEDFLGF